MQSVAQAWLVYRLTGSAAMLGLVTFMGQGPGFLLVPFGGTIADRRNRKAILISTQVAAMLLAFMLAALTLSNRIEVWHVFVLSALLGLVNAFDMPARQAFVVDMVGKEDLMNAIALNSTMINGTRLVGPAIAGLLVAAIGEGWCFFVNGASYVAVIVGLLMMKVTLAAARGPRKASALKSLAEGFKFVGVTAPIRALIILLGIICLMGLPYSVLMPVFADRTFQAGPGGLGLLMGAAGTGALIGALTLVGRRVVKGLGRWVAISSATFGVSLILFAWSHSFWLSTALLLPVGISMMLYIASSNMLVQAMVPDELRGRVMALYSMMFVGAAPVGALLAGGLAERIGASMTVALGGVGCILGAIIFSLRLPRLRSEARRLLSIENENLQHQTG